MNKVLEWKIKYEESDNPVIRASRLLTDKVTDIVGGLFQKTDLSETLTEICKLDPSFDRVQFLKYCETDIIPNILEAMVRGDLEILKDWCHEAPYKLLAQPLLQVEKLGYQLDNKILGIFHILCTYILSCIIVLDKIRHFDFRYQQCRFNVGQSNGTRTGSDNQLSIPANHVRERCEEKCH